MKQRILYITVRADHGGGPKHIADLAKGMLDEFDVFIASPKDEPYWTIYRTIVGDENCMELPHRKFTFGHLLKLVRFIRENKINIVHSHGKGAGIYSRCLKLFISVKVAHTFHGIHVYDLKYLAKILYLTIEKFMAILTDKFIAVSNSERLKASRLFKTNNITVINNGVKENLLKFKDDSFEVFTICRMAKVKNLKEFLDIAKLSPGIIFKIIGDGECKGELENKAKDDAINNVVFEGFKERPWENRKKKSVFLSTSLSEGLPIALIEAMMYGMPLLVSDVDGNNEVCQDGVNGFLYPLGDVTQASARLKDIADNLQLFERLSAGAKSDYKKRFSLDKMIDNTIKLYNAL